MQLCLLYLLIIFLYFKPFKLSEDCFTVSTEGYMSIDVKFFI